MVIFITYVAVQHCVFRGTNVALVLFALRTLNHLQVPLLLRALCLTACRKFKHFSFPFDFIVNSNEGCIRPSEVTFSLQ